MTDKKAAEIIEEAKENVRKKAREIASDFNKETGLVLSKIDYNCIDVSTCGDKNPVYVGGRIDLEYKQ